MRHRKHLNDFGEDGEDGAVISGGLECSAGRSECSAEGSKCWNLPRRNAGTFVWFFLAFSILFQLPIFPFIACQTFNNTKENNFIEWANVDYTGDSYSSIDYNVSGYHPWSGNPIGNPAFPGDTWSAGANWVGWITGVYNESLVLTNDLAVAGSVVQNVVNQIRTTFLPYAGQHPSWSPWTANNTLFVPWIGNNDCIRTQYNLTQNLDLLFLNLDLLYSSGAQNFLFMTVPPFDRSPSESSVVGLADRIEYWNSELPNYVSDFAAAHPGVSAAIYDAHALWTMVLDNPTKYGFKDATCNCSCNTCIWVDGLHSTYAMHKIFAADLTNFLGNTNHSLPSANTTTNLTGSASTSSRIDFTVFVLSLLLTSLSVDMLSGP